MIKRRRIGKLKGHIGAILFGILLTTGCVVQPVVVEQEEKDRAAEIQQLVEDQDLTVEQATILAQLDSRNPAPELTNETWLNTDNGEALRIADLRGNVVIVEFWTYG